MPCRALALTPPPRAFTRLEVITVIAILILLVLVLIPAFRTPKPLALVPASTAESARSGIDSDSSAKAEPIPAKSSDELELTPAQP
ncbi:MAG: hypothetical protein ABI680_06200 [Chthoniobacteraceae bacterium]